MRAITKTTYHFQRDGLGDAADETGVRRAVEEIVGLLALVHTQRLTGPEVRSIAAMTTGFTLEQFRLFRLIVANEINARRERHKDAAVNGAFSRAVLDQTSAIEAMATTAFAEIESLMQDAERVAVTGLELNSAERAAEFVAATVARAL